jgi:hypothetical protein
MNKEAKEVQELKDGVEMPTILHAFFADRGFNCDVCDILLVVLRVCWRT